MTAAPGASSNLDGQRAERGILARLRARVGAWVAGTDGAVREDGEQSDGVTIGPDGSVWPVSAFPGLDRVKLPGDTDGA